MARNDKTQVTALIEDLPAFSRQRRPVKCSPRNTSTSAGHQPRNGSAKWTISTAMVAKLTMPHVASLDSPSAISGVNSSRFTST